MLANTRRSVELLDELGVPYWSGHSRIAHGALLMLSDEHERAIPHFDRAAAELNDCGDINCWATSLGFVAECEIDLDRLDDAGAHLIEVIAHIDRLPLPEVHQARMVDRAAHLAFRRGEHELTATLLGGLANLPTRASIVPPATVRAGVDVALRDLLGRERTHELMDAGRELDFEALNRMFAPLLVS